jgi:hypothetical protein
VVDGDWEWEEEEGGWDVIRMGRRTGSMSERGRRGARTPVLRFEMVNVPVVQVDFGGVSLKA